MKKQNKLFKKGDRVVLIDDPTFGGTVTETKYVPKKGLSSGDYQWLYLDGSCTPCGSTSERFKLDESQPKSTEPTKGEWRTHLFHNKDTDDGYIVILNDEKLLFKIDYGVKESIKNLSEAQIYANLIIKAVNMYDKLLSFVKKFKEYNFSVKEMMTKAEELLK